MNGEILALLIPFAALMIPIVAILTSHQRKMAEFMNQPVQVGMNPEVNALRQEVAELRRLIHEQTIAIDNLNRPMMTPPAVPLQDRLTS